jgi:fructoselysine transporter
MATTPAKLERGLGLKEAAALNMIDMVGIGPFIVIPLVIKTMNGPQCILAWVAGALLALADGSVWAELGAAMPEAGGSYAFLRQIYNPKTWGKLMSFLFIWQTVIQAPLVVASGAIGFSQYMTFLVPMTDIEKKVVSGLLIILLTALLYRKTATLGKISIFLWVGVIGTIIWIIVGGITHFDSKLAFDYPKGAFEITPAFFVLLGMASVKTVYTYLGYYNVCHLGSEIKDPGRVIPKSIFISIFFIAALYLTMQMSVLGVIPWREAMQSEFIFSTFIEKLYGHSAASFATLLILWIAFSSLFAVLFGYSRIPYAAAEDGAFFKIFAKVHPTKHFPHVSLLILGGVAFVFSLLFRLSAVITAIVAMRILVQFIGQAVGVILWHRRTPKEKLPFKMWLFPIPAVLALMAWAGLFLSVEWQFEVAGLGVILTGVLIFLFRAKRNGEWPLASSLAVQRSGG